MSAQKQFLIQLQQQAVSCRHRAAVVLDGDQQWQHQLITDFLALYPASRVSKLGGDDIDQVTALSFKAGQQLLGTECDVLIFDDSNGFDANSFTAACGALVGGGMLLLLLSENTQAISWFARAFAQLHQLQPSSKPSLLPSQPADDSDFDPFAEQRLAVERIGRVLTGHRKRPLVLTADRGRGKSAALGIAAAQLMRQRSAKILVTAPARKAVEPLFTHARAGLGDDCVSQPNRLVSHEAALGYIAPDELLHQQPECDLLFIDEAAAIPLPLLIALVERYHRVVLSTTVHGYEGCGRGFTVKFSRWLDRNRPGWHQQTLQQPIRWAEQDPLEQWLFETFLLDAELPLSAPLSGQISSPLTFTIHHQGNLAENADVVRRCFALLVGAHYQTSPNDLLNLLSDKHTQLVSVEAGGQLVACLLLHHEGGMSDSLLSSVMSGERRPAGHLVASTLATQFAEPQAACLRCLRIMRIAVHPSLQGQGIGKQILEHLMQTRELEFDYLATSFGVTEELFNFWQQNGFVTLRLGAKRDQASGTHSVIMARSRMPLDWLQEAASRFPRQLLALLPETFASCEAALLSNILAASARQADMPSVTYRLPVVAGYCSGAISYESAYLDLELLIIERLYRHAEPLAPVLLAKFLQRHSWVEIARQFQFTGRKQAESYIRQQLSLYLTKC